MSTKPAGCLSPPAEPASRGRLSRLLTPTCGRSFSLLCCRLASVGVCLRLRLSPSLAYLVSNHQSTHTDRPYGKVWVFAQSLSNARHDIQKVVTPSPGSALIHQGSGISNVGAAENGANTRLVVGTDLSPCDRQHRRACACKFRKVCSRYERHRSVLEVARRIMLDSRR